MNTTEQRLPEASIPMGTVWLWGGGWGVGPLHDHSDLCAWLRANGVDPEQVYDIDGISVRTVLHRSALGQRLVRVVCFTQNFPGPDGKGEYNLLRSAPVTFERALPLTTDVPDELVLK